MFKNYLLTAWRNIIRKKIFSLIKILGLALSLSVCLLIIVIVNDQLSFDTFHPNANRIYRINTSVTHQNNTVENIATAPLPLTNMLNETAAIENVVSVDKDFTADMIVNGKDKITLNGMFTGPAFFKIFSFSLQTGDPLTVLNKPNSVVITYETADKLFGKSNPVGKIITLQKFGDFEIAGVLNKITEHSQLKFDMLGSFASIKSLEQRKVINPTLISTNNYYSNYLYVLLQHGKSQDDLSKILTNISKNLGYPLNANDKSIRFYAEHITGPSDMAIGNNTIPKNVLWALSILGLIVIVSACFNYTNLSIASSLFRAKEIGMRKTMGADRAQIFIQFILESVIISLISLIISIALWRFIGTGFKQMVPQLELNLKVGVYVYVLFLLFSVFTGIIAGLFPALYLSAFKPVHVLKGFSQLKLLSKLPMQKTLLLIQFVFCCISIISITIIYRQLNYVMNADYGFNKSNIINLDLQGMPYQVIIHEVAKYSGVDDVSASSGLPGTENVDEIKVQKKSTDKIVPFNTYAVNENFTKNLNIPLIAGKNFTPEAVAGKAKLVIINEKALQILSLGTASESIGKNLILNDSTYATIIGVVKNFNYLPLTNSIGPLILRPDPSAFKYLNIRIAGNKEKEVIAFLQPLWNSMDNVHRIKYSYYNSDITNSYQPFQTILSIISFIGLLAVVITCMGLLGLVIFAIKNRMKEISIRKVLGSGVVGLVWLVSKSFFKLLLFASLIAIPIGYLLGTIFLEEFAYKINIGIGTILFGVAVIYAMVFTTICFHTITAAVSNPLKSLRSE